MSDTSTESTVDQLVPVPVATLGRQCGSLWSAGFARNERYRIRDLSEWLRRKRPHVPSLHDVAAEILSRPELTAEQAAAFWGKLWPVHDLAALTAPEDVAEFLKAFLAGAWATYAKHHPPKRYFN
jgi:hypothetical protein